MRRDNRPGCRAVRPWDGRTGERVPSSRVTEILADIVNDQTTPGPIAARLCRRCAESVPVSGVGLALMNEDRPSGTVAVSDGTAREMEDLQFATGEGPCVDASRSGRPVLQPDLQRTATARWPGFGPEALAAGIRAIFAFPLQVGVIRIGVLDLYRDRPGALDDPQLADALAFADAALLVLLHLQDQSGRHGDPGALTAAMDSRAEVHQATGMVSVQLAVSMAEALLRLRARAYAEGRPVSAVSGDVVARRIRFDLGDSG